MARLQGASGRVGDGPCHCSGGDLELAPPVRAPAARNQAVTLLTPHFTFEEAQCHCGCTMPPDIQKKALAMAHIAEAVRANLGRPMIVDSWYRCPKHNAE